MPRSAHKSIFDYVRIQGTGNDTTVDALYPINTWPHDINQRYGWIVRMLAAIQDPEALLNCDSHAVQCEKVHVCPVKKAGLNNADCPRLAMGLCADATFEFNSGTIPFRTLAHLFGISPTRVQQIQAVTIRKLRRCLLADSAMLEMCQQFGVARSMAHDETTEEGGDRFDDTLGPTSDQLATEIAQSAGL